MDETEFWALIDRSRAGAEDDPDEQAEQLRELLTGRTSEELQAFDRRYRERLVAAGTWDLWAAGYLLRGGMSDDGFDYFCDWLISRGRETFERVLRDPDALAGVPGAADEETETEAESLRYAVQEAHEETHHDELPFADDMPVLGDPAGEEFDEDDLAGLARRFPRIWALVEDMYER
jgi:hypothetical protein